MGKPCYDEKHDASWLPLFLSATYYLALLSFVFLLSGFYFTGDGARRDADGYYWITGRVDDVINPSGHRIGNLQSVQFILLLYMFLYSNLLRLFFDYKREFVHNL